MVKSVLITGGNRGIGLEFARQFLTQKVLNFEKIIVTCRDPLVATELNELKNVYPTQLHIIKLDVTEWDTYDNLVKNLEKIVGVNCGLTLLINNAGILQDKQDLHDLDPKCMIEEFKVNCIAPILLSKSFLPLLRTASQNSVTSGMSMTRAGIVNISSDWGSIKERETSEWGSLYPYRCSKNALNMGMKNLAIDLKRDGIMVTSLHPGWVKTDMGGPDGELTPEQSVLMMLKTMSNMSEEDNGTFVQFNGTSLPW